MKIVKVDGYKIRQHLDTDFQIIHTRTTDPTIFDPKFYIPNNEMWVDYRFFDEVAYLLEIKKQLGPRKGKNYLRRRKKLIHDLRQQKLNPTVYQKILGDSPKICYVLGNIVRKYLDPGFVQGGHHYVYDYIPKNEIWIDCRLDKRDLPHVLLHESKERELMSKKGIGYDVAHEFANAYERESRRKCGAIYPGDANWPSNWTQDYLTKLFKIKS